jgi:hypothetical protein
MRELKDYSGKFIPDLNMADFSKEALVKLWHASGLMYTSQAQCWHDVVEERFGSDMVKEIEAEVWRRQSPKEIGICRRAMNIMGNDVKSILKHLQIDPGAGGIWPEEGFEIELKDQNTGILTIKNCIALNYFEKTGSHAYQKFVCEVLDGEGFADTARVFNPRIKATPLKLPPRESKDDIACQWEFKRMEDDE